MIKGEGMSVWRRGRKPRETGRRACFDFMRGTGKVAAVFTPEQEATLNHGGKRLCLPFPWSAAR